MQDTPNEQNETEINNTKELELKNELKEIAKKWRRCFHCRGLRFLEKENIPCPYCEGTGGKFL